MFHKLVALGRRYSEQTVSGARLLLLYHRIRAVAVNAVSDEEFAQRSYRRAVGRTLDLERPTTFDERLWWLKLNYRDPLMVQCTDKLAVRDYVQEQGFGSLLSPLLAVYDSPDEIEWDALPSRFYMKTTHSSAANVRCDDIGEFDKRRAAGLMRVYLARRHYPLSREWNYIGIRPRIMVEPIIETDDPNGLVDYRFLCSHGRCNGIFVDVDTAASDGRHRDDARRNVYDREWNRLDVRVTRPPVGREIARPAVLDDMRRVAEALSHPFPFCRVDLYHPTPGKILFGEMTFFHSGGNNVIEPPGYDEILGQWVDIDDLSGTSRARVGDAE